MQQNRAILDETLSLATLGAGERFSSLNTGTAAEILLLIESLHKTLFAAGIPSRPYTAQAADKLVRMPEEQKRAILQQLRPWIAILASTAVAADMNFLDETRMVERALDQFNFNLKNHTWDTTAGEQILEIYNAQGMQLYRSLGFFKTCGYSLLDLCVNEWFVLWERPQKVVQQMNEVVASVLSGKKTDTVVNIAPHLILETYDDGCTQPFIPRAIFVGFKNIYPLYSIQDQVCGFIVTSSARLICEGEDSLKINFI
jgi:hypothetical protein